MMPFQRYQETPRLVSAVQWDGTIEHAHSIQRHFDELELDYEFKFIELLGQPSKPPTLELEFRFVVRPGDWIVLVPVDQDHHKVWTIYQYPDKEFRELYTTLI